MLWICNEKKKEDQKWKLKKVKASNCMRRNSKTTPSNTLPCKSEVLVALKSFPPPVPFRSQNLHALLSIRTSHPTPPRHPLPLHSFSSPSLISPASPSASLAPSSRNPFCQADMCPAAEATAVRIRDRRYVRCGRVGVRRVGRGHRRRGCCILGMSP